MTEQRTVQYQQECITVTDVSGDYFGLPRTQIPVYRRLVCLPGYNTGLVFFGNGSGDFLGLPGTTGGWYVCRDTILVRYFWEWFRRFPWAPRDLHTGVGVPVAGSFFVVEIQYPVKKILVRYF